MKYTAVQTVLLTVTQMAIQRTTRLTIRLDVLVDALRTQSNPIGRRQPTHNLLGTPLLTGELYQLAFSMPATQQIALTR